MKKLFICSLALCAFIPQVVSQVAPKDSSLILRAERRVMVESIIDGSAPIQTAGGTAAPGAAYSNYHYDDECIAIFDDGSYRMERARHAADDRKLTVKVYVGQLSPQRVAELVAIRDDPEFQKINADRNTGKFTYERNGEQIAAWVPRQSGEQHFRFTTVGSRSGYSKALKPFLNWWHTLDKQRPSDPIKAESTGCKSR